MTPRRDATTARAASPAGAMFPLPQCRDQGTVRQ